MNLGPIYCINLPDRTDRWSAVTGEFLKAGIHNVIRFDAVRLSPGWAGCRESHMALLERCRDVNRFTIFEDDVRFVGDVQGILDLAEQQLPEYWDMLYLGANLQAPITRYSQNIYNLHHGFCTHAIIFNNADIPDFVLSAHEGMRKIDVFYETVLQQVFNCFITYPMIATQADSFSDVIHQDTRYSKQMVQNFNSKLR
jgi:GR25 family glycosyltransferase involved in LPS biosynthesis